MYSECALALHHRQAGEEHGVEERRRVLADAAADALAQHAVGGDDRRVVEAAVGRARAHRGVQRERLARGRSTVPSTSLAARAMLSARDVLRGSK